MIFLSAMEATLVLPASDYKIFTMNYVSTVVEKTRVASIASVRVQTRPATIKIFTMNYVSTVVEKTRIASIAERNILIP